MSVKVKEAIEEVIEESYLMGLSEQEICEDFRRFIDTCYEVLYRNIKNREVLNGLAETLEREQTFVLMADYAEERSAQLGAGEDSAIRSLSEIFAEKAARRKRQILRTIAQYDPQLVRLIDAQRFQGEIKEPSRPRFRRTAWRPDWDRLRLRLLKVGYCAIIGLIILLLYLGFVAKS